MDEEKNSTNLNSAIQGSNDPSLQARVSEPKAGSQREEQKPELSELEKIKKQAEEYLDGWKRAKADYINYKKEAEHRQQELLGLATAGMILNILPIFDSLKKAIKHMPEECKNEPWGQGVVGIKKQFDDFLNQIKIEEIPTEGVEFNPELHEAVGKRKEKGKKTDEILEEVSTGFKSGGKVVVPAKVIVAE